MERWPCGYAAGGLLCILSEPTRSSVYRIRILYAQVLGPKLRGY